MNGQVGRVKLASSSDIAVVFTHDWLIGKIVTITPQLKLTDLCNDRLIVVGLTKVSITIISWRGVEKCGQFISVL